MENVNKIIDLLCDRNGFDDWWHNLDNKIKNEIKQEIKSALAKCSTEDSNCNLSDVTNWAVNKYKL